MHFFRSGHGVAAVTPLPPKLSKEDLAKSPSDDAGNDESTRDDLPLLKLGSSNDEKGKVDDENPVTIVLPSTSRSCGLERVQGLAFIVVAALNFSIVSACVKYASRHASPHVIVFWRMVIGLAMNTVWAYYTKANLLVAKKDRSLVLFRCLVGAMGTSMSFYAMSNMPLTDAVVIIFTSPIFTFFLAAVVLGEAIDYVDLVGGITSFIGVLFVTRPAILFPSRASTASAPLFAIICAMGASLSQAIVYITMRKMRHLDNMILIHYFLVFGVFYSGAMLWILGVRLETPMEPEFIFSMLGCAFFALVGQIFLAKGFQTVKAGIASVMRYFDVVFVMCLDAVVLGETINLYSIFGAAIIISGASVIVMRQASAKK
ncbi:hypothetical protein PHYBOEH_008248 [Phytophthora boehmeriae]|uniref:EamA domain-containing protein n=1 Tax=Phytophthora boehmeriae TaxID=109152 RepID=A0A8T1W0M4_9STRA|nr:hypothetical protein PHYBOEH_008248 [Phytophthora boehmeriae]